MRTRTIVLGALLWVLIVAGGSMLTWSVISTAGARVGPLTVPTMGGETTEAASEVDAGVWTGAAGRITARCSASGVALVTASPNLGFSVDIKDKGPEKLRVEFEARREESETTVHATCENGRPVFHVE